eukprot:182327-Chlamydomonas_euryale.AAC.2
MQCGAAARRTLLMLRPDPKALGRGMPQACCMRGAPGAPARLHGIGAGAHGSHVRLHGAPIHGADVCLHGGRMQLHGAHVRMHGGQMQLHGADERMHRGHANHAAVHGAHAGMHAPAARGLRRNNARLGMALCPDVSDGGIGRVPRTSSVAATDASRGVGGGGAVGGRGLLPVVWHPSYSKPQLAPGHRFPMQVGICGERLIFDE